MSSYIMPNLQKDKIESCLKEGKRLDGRKVDEYRDIVVETDVSKNSSSAVRVKFGKTEVLAGVHLALATPYPDSPDSGTFMTSAELHPMASQQFDIGRPGIDSVELARVIDRGIRESGFIDMKKLCIKEGEKVYQVFVDIFAINDDGNVLDVAGLAALIALGRARMPIYNEEEDKIDGYSDTERIPLNKDVLSFSMTFHKIGDTIAADVGREEEAISKFRLTIAMGDNEGNPRITAMQKGKAGTISSKDMETILSLAESKWKNMFPEIKEHVLDKMESKEFSKYERARIIGARGLQISMDAPLLVDVDKNELDAMNFDPLKIAEKELDSGVLPISVSKPMPKKNEEAIENIKVEDDVPSDEEKIAKEREIEAEIVESGDMKLDDGEDGDVISDPIEETENELE